MNIEISRRDFLKKGSKSVLAAAAIPYVLRSDIAKALTGPAGKELGMHDYYAHFGVTDNIIRDTMAEALSKGGDYCDVFFQHSIYKSVSLEDKAVNRAYSNIDFGVGIRVLKGDQTGYSFTEELSPKAMKLAASTAANIANSGKKRSPISLQPLEIPNYYPIKTSWEDVAIDQKIPYLETLNDKVFSLDSRIIKCNVRFNDATSWIMVATSEGTVAYDFQPMMVVSISVTAEENGKRESNYAAITGRCGIEVLTPSALDRLAKKGVKKALELLKAKKPEGGEMEVVLAAGSSGILLHEAIGHGMEADFNRKGESIFSDKIDKFVAKPFVSIVDDGTNPGYRGSINVDDEGNLSEKTFLVKDGVLKSYIHDRISAKHYGLKPTGNGRRESFRFEPLPRMRNTYMLPGSHTKEEIIKSVRKGLYAESFTNGEVHIGPGDFTFYVKSGYVIENGELTTPVKDVNIIGNGPKVLEDIVMVADDFKMDESNWTCGKGGQGIPVSLGLPTVKVSKITVGGVS